MAADILIYHSDVVPVGEDQKQNIEICRDLAGKLNRAYDEELLKIPEEYIVKSVAVVPGIDGQKMSKSYKNVIPVFTETDSLRKAVRRIKTNSKEPGEPKDTENCTIFKIYKSFSNSEEINQLALKYKEGIAWGEAKEILFQKLEDNLSGYKSEYTKIIGDRAHVEETLVLGSKKALEVSLPLIEQVRKAVGIKGFAKL